MKYKIFLARAFAFFSGVMEFLNRFAATRPNLYFFSLGFFSILAAAPIYWFFVYFLVFPLLLKALYHETDRRILLKRSFFFGFGFSLSHFYWISFSLIVRSKILYFFFPFAFVLIPAYFACYYVLQFYLLFLLKQKLQLSKLTFYFGFAISWVLFEFIRAKTIMLVSFPGFPWGFLGYDIFFSDRLAQLGYYVSVYVISLGIILSTALPFLFQLTIRNIAFLVVFLAVIFVPLFFLGDQHIKQFSEQKEVGVSYKIIHPNITEHHGFDQKKLLKAMDHLKTLSMQGDNTDLVIWPEGSISYLLDVDDPHHDLLDYLMEGLAPESKMALGFPRKTSSSKNYYNSMMVLNPEIGIEDYYDKRFLVPFGEFMPYSSVFNLLPLVSNKGQYAPGENDFVVGSKSLNFMGLICYDALFPGITRDRDTEFIVNISNDIWFIQEIFGYNISLAPFQHLDILRMRAIEAGKPILRATNRGISGVISPTGHLEKSLSYDETGVIIGRI